MTQHATFQAPDFKHEEESKTINVKFVASSGEEVFFKTRCTTKLSKLQGAYANKVGKDVSIIRASYDGKRIHDDNTPASLGMEDNAVIDIMYEQFAG